MNRKTYGFLGVILLLTLWFPWLLFLLQDQFTLNRSYALQDTASSHDLMETYPVIAQIYADFYDGAPPYEKEGQYDLTDISTYEKEIQETLKEHIQAMELAITDLILANVITPNILLQSNSQYEISFGTLSAFSSLSNSSYLTQTFSIDGEYVRSSDFHYLINSNKITSIHITNEKISRISEKQQKEMAKAMISYLGLEDIEDWTATEYGFESYQAKLQINCDVTTYGIGYANLDISVSPLGQYRQTTDYTIQAR